MGNTVGNTISFKPHRLGSSMNGMSTTSTFFAWPMQNRTCNDASEASNRSHICLTHLTQPCTELLAKRLLHPLGRCGDQGCQIWFVCAFKQNRRSQQSQPLKLCALTKLWMMRKLVNEKVKLQDPLAKPNVSL